MNDRRMSSKYRGTCGVWGLNIMSERDQDTAFQYAMEDKPRNPWI